MWFKKSLLLAAFFVATGVSVGAAKAQEAKKVLTATAIPYNPPFEFKDPITNKMSGFSVDFVEAVAAKLGAKVNWIDGSFDQIISSIQTKRVDIAIMADNSPERRELVNFVDFVSVNSVFYTMSSNAAEFPTMDALCGKRVAATRSAVWPSSIATWSDQNCTKLGKAAVVVVGTTGMPDSRLQLNQGRVDASVLLADTLTYYKKDEGDRYVILGKPFKKDYEAIAFAKDDISFRESVEKAVGALMADGTYMRLQKKWNLSEESALQRPLLNGQP